MPFIRSNGISTQTTVEDKAAKSLTKGLSLTSQALDIEERTKSLAETRESLVLYGREEREQ